MILRDALTELVAAVDKVLEAARSDDKTPLENALALREDASFFGREGTSFDVVVFGDLNRFNGLNDTNGHDAGDTAIGHVGKMIKERIIEPCKAKAFHPSGDEFVILLSQDCLPNFISLAPSFGECLFQYDGESLKTGMSFGYAITGGEDDFETLRLRAETACQYAKTLGDGVCIEWTEEIERESLTHLRERLKG